MDALKEIETIVEEYNEIEAEQVERLRRLFDLVDARKGFRAVYFNNNISAWMNCWGMKKRLAHAKYIDQRGDFISEVEPGEE